LAPFPELLGLATADVQIANLGYGGAGPEFYVGFEEYVRLCRDSAFVVLQVMSARSCSSPRYKVIWGNRALDASTGRLTTYPQFLRSLRREDPDAVAEFVREQQESYVRSTIRLIKAIERPVFLLWVSSSAPMERASPSCWHVFPHLVDRDCVKQVLPHVAGYVEVIGDADDFRAYYPSQRLHHRVFEILLEHLVQRGCVRARAAVDMRGLKNSDDNLKSQRLLAAIRDRFVRAPDCVTEGHAPPAERVLEGEPSGASRSPRA
jgi:hypothetical protein